MSSYINSYRNTSGKAKLIALTRHIERFSNSGISIYKADVVDAACRTTTTRRRTQAIAKRYAFHPNTIRLIAWWYLFYYYLHIYLKVTLPSTYLQISHLLFLVSILLLQVILSDKMFENV